MTRFLYTLTLLLLLAVTAFPASVPDSLLNREYRSKLHSYKDYLQYYDTARYAMWFDGDGRFNLDTMLYIIATEGVESVVEELHYYFTQVVNPLYVEEEKAEIEKIRNYAHHHKSDMLFFLADLLVTNIVQVEYPGQDRITPLGKLAERYRNKPELYVNILSLMFKESVVDTRYSTAFNLATELAGELEKASRVGFLADKGDSYYDLGELYYRFRDYSKAIPLLEKSLPDTIRYFRERHHLQARNTLGLYYRSQNDMDRSDDYFLSMLTDTHIVKFKPMYDAMAISNLGRNAKLRGEYAEALRLLRISLPKALDQEDYPFAAGLTADIGECYFVLGQTDKVRDMIDTTTVYMHVLDPFYSRHTNLKLYSLMSKYYAHTGNASLSAAYLDSTVAANRRYEDEFNALIIKKAEQEQHDAEQAISQEKVRERTIQLIGIGIILLLVLIGTVLLAWFYKRKQDAYRELVLKSQQWAGIAGSDIDPDDSINEEAPLTDDVTLADDSETVYISIMEKADRLMREKKLFADPECSQMMLAGILGVDRRILSAAINSCTQKHFASYINEYRIKEAVRILSEPGSRNLSIDGIALDAGFNDRKNFHRIFKQYTGLTPATFRNNMRS